MERFRVTWVKNKLSQVSWGLRPHSIYRSFTVAAGRAASRRALAGAKIAQG